MKRYFSFAILLALLLSVFSLGYADVVQVGEGTAYSSVLPIYGFYHYSYSQQIYTQAQINHDGPIQKIRFFYRSGSIANNKDWTIWMGHTTKTEFASVSDWEAPVNLTQVFTGDVTDLMPAAENEWLEITLTTPFNYNNTDNLLIAVHQYTPGYGSMSWGSFTSTSNTGMYARSDTDNPDPNNPYDAYGRTDKINRIQLIFPTTTPPLAPTLISPLNGGYAIDGESLSWTFGSGGAEVDDYDVYFGTTADPPLVSSNQVETTYLPALQPSTTYYWKVVAHNQLGSSPASEIWSFRTPDADQLVESFEDADFPPMGWSGTWSNSTSNPYHGSRSAYRSASTSTQHTLSTPLLSIEAGSTLSFWARCTSSSGILQIVHSQDGETWDQLGNDITYPATGVWYNHNIDLSDLSGGNHFLGFRNGLVSGSHYLDLVIGPSVAAVAPGVPELNAPAEGATGVSNYPFFTWNAPASGGMPTHYNIYCDANPTPTTLIGTSTGTRFVPANALPYNSTLYWTVTAVNDVAESAPATPRSFTTMADNTIYDLPWLEEFTDAAFPPANWERYIGEYPVDLLEPTTYRWTRRNFANVSDPANPSACANIYGTGTKHWLVTPPISIPAGAYQLEFDLALTKWSSSNPVDPTQQQDDRFIVLIADNPTMVNPTVLRLWNNTDSEYVYNNITTLGESQIIDLSAHTGVRYIGFYGESKISGGDNGLFVDNVKVCQTPTNPIFTYAPDAIDFGTVMYDVASEPVNVTVTNMGSGIITLTASDISIIGPNAAEFSFGTDGLTANLATGESVNIPVTVQSTTAGAISATLRMTYGGVNYDVALSANVMPQGILFIGEGTLYNTDTGAPCVYGGWFKNGREQYLITAAELTAAGAQPGLISSLGFNVFDPRTSADLLNFSIKIGATDATGFANDEFFTNLQDVYTEGLYTPIVGWNNHTFDTPFYWDGTSNIVVQTSYDLIPAVLRNARTYYTYDSANQVLYYRSDTIPWHTVAAGTPSSNRPNMMLNVVEPGAGIPDAPVLTWPADAATGLPKNGFNLTWTPGDMLNFGVPDGYAVLMSTDIDNIFDDLRWETTSTSFNPVTDGNLNFAYNQRYYWTVSAYNIHGEAVVDPARSFVIEDDPTINALPYVENFDAVTLPNLPTAWTAYKSNSGSTIETRTNYSQTPDNSVYMYNRTSGEDLRLITPPITVPINTIKLSFWLRASSTSNYSMKVGTVSATDGTGVFTQVAEIVPTASSAWVQYQISFADYTGTDQYICFQHGANSGYQTFYLDSVLMETMPTVDLEAVALTGPALVGINQEATFNLTVLNFGIDAVPTYTVNLKDNSGTLLGSTVVTEALVPGLTAEVPVTWTPTTAGTNQIYGEVIAAGDGNAANNQSALKSVYVTAAADEFMVLGDPDTTSSANILPFSMYYRCCVSEELYFPDEMRLQAGTITAILYKPDFVNSYQNKAFKVYMKHTTAENLTDGWLPSDDYTLVFDGTIDMNAGTGDIIIPLTTPFNYTGGVLATRVFRDMDTGPLSSSDKFFYTTTSDHSDRSRYIRSDSVTYNPLDPTGTSYKLSYMPNTTFVVQNATWEQSAMLSGYVYEADGTTPVVGADVTLTDERYSTTTNSDGYYQFRFWEAHTVTATASKHGYYSQTVTGIQLAMGAPVEQNFILGAMPRITVSGIVNTNDIPGGAEGAKIKLNGIEDHEVFSGTGGAFSIANVLGSNEGIPYTVTITLADYQGYSGEITAMETAINMGTITLNEFTWPVSNLVATHSGDNALLSWDAAAAPTFFFWDFEADDGDWIGSGYGDWEWSNTYPTGGTFNWTQYESSCVPPAEAHSGTGLWGTKLYTNHSNSGAWSYLTNTVDLTGIESPQLRFWRWNNLNGSWDYYEVQVSTDGENWTTELSENVENNAWVEKVVDLSAYTDQTLHVRFAMYASTVVAYAGLYIDDVYIGNPPAEGKVASRALENYSVYRFPIAEEATPDNWTQLASNVSGVEYTDTGFGALAPGGYKWAVKANYTGSLASDAVISNKLGILVDVTEFQITRTADNVTLTWAAQDGASFYRIYSSDDPYGTFTLLGTSETASFTTAAGNAMKFFKVTAVSGETPAPAPGGRKN